MSDRTVRRRRHPERAVELAAVVGLASGFVIALLTILLTVFIGALNENAGLGQAFRALAITDSEDWELIPMFLAGAIVVGAVASVAAVAVWWEVTTRMPGRPWVARAGAAAAAAILPLLLLPSTSSWLIAVPVAVSAALVAAVAAPLVSYDRPRPGGARWSGAPTRPS